ncbi:MAG: hypothetical protein AAF389_07260 [Gemmatimonadota bacterium]
MRKILEAAADLQERSSARGTGSARGLTIQELRQVAAEAGIDPHFVDIAATDIDAPMEKGDGSIIGGPDRWHFRTTLPGEIDDDDRDRILLALRGLMGHRGVHEEVYGRMEWSMNDGMGPTTIGVVSRDGTTEVDMTVNRSGEAGLLHGLGVPLGGLLIGAVTAASTGISGPIVVPVMGLAAGGVFVATRLMWRKRSQYWDRKLRKTMQRISSIVQESTRMPSADAPAQIPPPQEDA